MREVKATSAEIADLPVTNIFVLMLENHSFDNMFAMSGIMGLQVATKQDSNRYDGMSYHVRDGAPSSMTTDPGHEFLDVLEQLCGAEAAAKFAKKYAKCSADFTGCDGSTYPKINLSGFASSYATSDSEKTGRPAKGHIGDVMACFKTPKQLPVINQLANEFAICDAWFSSMPGPTWPNRFFVHGASSAGMDRSPDLKEEVEWETVHGFEYEKGSIYKALNDANQGWRLYQDKDNAFSDNPSRFDQGGWISQVASLKGIHLWDIHSLSKFRNDLGKDDGAHYRENYPYTFIEPNFGASFQAPQQNSSEPGPNYKGGSSQHPEDNPYGGEALIKFVYETVFNSPLCDTSLLIIVYDEHGGFYDSVPPQSAIPPGDKTPKGQESLNSYCFDFSRLGVRVPAVIVSPLIPKSTVDHTIYDHSSILATLERKLGIPPLTERDKNANDVWHLLTKSESRKNIPKTLCDPARIPGQNASQNEATEPDDLPLPESGNLSGFLLVLLKAEIEIAKRNGGRPVSEITRDFGKITTHRHAREYLAKMKAMIDSEAGAG